MFAALLKKELLDLTITNRYRTLLLLIVLTGLLATVVRTHMYLEFRAAHRQAGAARERVRLAIEERLFTLLVGHTQQKPPNPLSIFCTGIEDEMTRSLRVLRSREDQIGPRAMSSLYSRLVPALDVCTLTALLVSLASLLLMHDAVSRERERGTLKVLLAGAVPRPVLLLVKWVAGIAAVGLPLVVAWLAGIVYVLAVARPGFSATQSAALFSMVVWSFVYVGVFVGAGLAASACCSRSTTSLSVCLLFWVAVALVAPTVVVPLTRRVARTPPLSRIRRHVQRTYRQVESELAADWERFVPNTADPVKVRFMRASAVRTESAASIRSIYADFRNLLAEQRFAATSLVALSPVTGFTFVSAELAGTGMGSYVRLHDAWQVAADAYKEEQFTWMRTRDIGSLPRLTMPPVSLTARCIPCFVPIVSMFVYAVILLNLAVLIFTVYPRIHTER